MTKSYKGSGSTREAAAILLENFGNEDRIAVIPSAFQMRVSFPFPLWSLRPTEKFVAVLHRILEQIGTTYVSVHIRFEDRYFFRPETLGPDCGKDDYMVETFENVFRKIEDVAGGGRAKADDTVYLASNLDKDKKCFDTILGSRNGIGAVGNATTLLDIIAADPGIRDLMDEIKLEESDKAVVLDQLLLGLGKFLLTEDARGVGSTFQGFLRLRHKYRDDLLSRIKNYTK